MFKKIILTIAIIASLVSANMCTPSYSENYVNKIIQPMKSGQYKVIQSSNSFSNGKAIHIGDGYTFNNWENNNYLDINCKVIDVDLCYDYSYNSASKKEFFEYTLDCDVSDKIQFYYPKVYYKDTKGYRNDGTLLWSRSNPGSTDITCYSKNGLNEVKRVNSPAYCK